MSVDLGGIRTQIGVVLATIPELKHIDKYELRDRDDADMPLATVWRDTASGPDVNQPQPEFGRFGFSFTWLVRVYIPLDSDVEAETLGDALTLRLFDAFNDPANALAASGLVDEWRLRSVDAIPVLDIQRPSLLLEGTLVTQASS